MLAVCLAVAAASVDKSNGFNSNIDWIAPADLQARWPLLCSQSSCITQSLPSATGAWISSIAARGCARQGITHSDKPVLYLFAQPWCGACKRLKADFEANGEALVPISTEFVMVNVYGDDNKMFGVSFALKCYVLDHPLCHKSAFVCCTLQRPAPYPGMHGRFCSVS